MAATATPKKEAKPRAGDATPEAASAHSTPAAVEPKKRPFALVGLVLGIVAAAYLAFLLAAPSDKQAPRFAGPFTTELFPDKYQVNLSGGGMKRFLQVVLSVIYEAYDEQYIVQRTRDPLYDPYLQSTVLAVCSAKTVEEVQGRANNDALMEELREELDPVMFPVHLGETRFALDFDPKSGLRPGLSHERATFRGTFHDHFVHVDAAARTLGLGDGAPVSFRGDEMDLQLTDAYGETFYVDVTRLSDGFTGKVKVGVHGRIRRILPKYFLVQ